MKRLMLKRTDGGISELMPGPKFKNETEDEHTNRVLQQTLVKLPKGHILEGAELCLVCDHTELPDQYFFNAFTFKEGSITVDMEKAVEVQKAHLRGLRTPKLLALDIAYTRAQEANNLSVMAEVTATKQLLRDVTKDPALLQATTPEELKKIIPTVLLV